MSRHHRIKASRVFWGSAEEPPDFGDDDECDDDFDGEDFDGEHAADMALVEYERDLDARASQ